MYTGGRVVEAMAKDPARKEGEDRVDEGGTKVEL